MKRRELVLATSSQGWLPSLYEYIITGGEQYAAESA
jgi:hypothetical protein